MGRLLGGKEPAKNIAAAPPTRTRTTGDGDVVTEKLCPMPSLKMVNPRGVIVHCAVANGITVNPNTTYRTQIERQKLEAGFLRYDECPVGKHDWIPVTDKQKRCKAGTYSKDQCCPHVLKVIETRRARTKRKADKFAQRFESTADALIRHLQGQQGPAPTRAGVESKVPR